MKRDWWPQSDSENKMYTFRCCQTQPNQIDIGYIPALGTATKVYPTCFRTSSVSLYFQDHPAQENQEFWALQYQLERRKMILFSLWQKLRRLPERHTSRSCSVIERETLCVPITTVAARKLRQNSHFCGILQNFAEILS